MKRVSPNALPYRVESVDIVAEHPELRVSILSLVPGQEVPWHYHTRVTDTFFCLSGSVAIQHGASGKAELSAGDWFEVPAGTPHRVTGSDSGTSRFLIVQGIGKYDFIPAHGPSSPGAS